MANQSNYNLTQTGAEVQRILDSVETIDTTPASGSDNPISSGAVHAAIATLNSLISSNSTLLQTVIAQAVAELLANDEGLMARIANLGDAKADSIDLAELPKVCGYPLVVEGAGAPSVVPYFVGQRYHDTTNKKVYEAFAVTNSTSDWTLLN